ncbi:hypothetical protein J6590_092510 [Homalodisca vitripennis]|nr:hypothetical protein J6590_092510 [Homalodisca vitripennis]
MRHVPQNMYSKCVSDLYLKFGTPAVYFRFGTHDFYPRHGITKCTSGFYVKFDTPGFIPRLGTQASVRMWREGDAATSTANYYLLTHSSLHHPRRVSQAQDCPYSFFSKIP